MKLNLLPTYVGRERSAKLAIIIAVMMIAGSAFASVTMVKKSKDALEATKLQASQARTEVDKLVKYTTTADAIIKQAEPFVKHVNLARAMDAHNNVYPQFYATRVFPFIPGFYRINNISAAPNDDKSATVTMQGFVKNHQQYTDLLLAMLRIPGAGAVQRSPMGQEFGHVTPLDRENQESRYVDPEIGPLPKDPLERLDALIARGGVTGADPQGGFGSLATNVRGAMPDYTPVTVTLVIHGVNLLTPDPRATIAPGSSNPGGGGGAGAANARGGAGGAGGKLGGGL